MGALGFVLLHGCEPPGPATGPTMGLAAGSRLAATVTRVADGDTITVKIEGGPEYEREEEIRMIGVDTPETVDPDEPVQCFGPEASDFTHGALAPGTSVELEIGVEARDAYGRLLAYVFLSGRLFNAELARRGLARPLTFAPNDARAPLFESLAVRAAGARRGLWGSCDGG